MSEFNVPPQISVGFQNRGDTYTGKFSWMGFSVADWESDFKTRLAKIRLASEKKKLAMIEKQLESLMSDELKTDMQIAEIEKQLE
jgi:hypothetical protein